MALVKCKECEKEVSDKAEKCPNCGAPIEVKSKSFRLSKSEGGGCLSKIIKFFGFGLLLLFGYVMFIAPNHGGKGLLESDFTVEISGTSGLRYSGSYMVTSTTGKSASKSVEGKVPGQYNVTGNIVSVSFQKKSESGSLKVQILKGGNVVAETETSAAYGVASVATN